MAVAQCPLAGWNPECGDGARRPLGRLSPEACGRWREVEIGSLKATLRGGTMRVSCGYAAMFLFFSNKLGCLGSLVLSAAITLVALLMLGVVHLPRW